MGTLEHNVVVRQRRRRQLRSVQSPSCCRSSLGLRRPAGVNMDVWPRSKSRAVRRSPFASCWRRPISQLKYGFARLQKLARLQIFLLELRAATDKTGRAHQKGKASICGMGGASCLTAAHFLLLPDGRFYEVSPLNDGDLASIEFASDKHRQRSKMCEECRSPSSNEILHLPLLSLRLAVR